MVKGLPMFNLIVVALTLLSLAWQCLVPALAESYTLPAPLAKQLQQANTLANSGDYEKAAAAYETLRQSPHWEARLNRPLTTLYYNLAAQAHQGQQAQAAEKWLAKGFLVSPNDAGLKTLQSYVLYEQGMEQARLYEDYAKAISLLQQAKTLNPTERNLDKALASLYLQWAQKALQEQKPDEAVTHAEQALQLSPEEPALKHSVARLYLSRASKAEKKAEQQVWIDKALTTDNSAELEAEVKSLQEASNPLNTVKEKLTGLNPLADERPAVTHPFLEQGSQPLHSLPALEQVQVLEHVVFGQTQQGTLPERVESLETAFLGENQPGTLSKRVTALAEAVLPEDGTVASSETYLPAVLQTTGGRLLRFAHFPLRVYLQPAPSATNSDKPKAEQSKDKVDLELLPFYREPYNTAVQEALQAWTRETMGFVSFTLVKDPAVADVKLFWAEESMDAYDIKHLPETRSFYQGLGSLAPSKLSKTLHLASAFTPGVYGLIPQVGAAVADYNTYAKWEAVRKYNAIALGLKPLTELPEKEAETLLYNQVLRDFGRVLGLKALSPVMGDVAFGSPSSQVRQRPSSRDLATLRQLYLRKPDLPLN
jgi:tetratricopeptide (TPR) repeat protein